MPQNKLYVGSKVLRLFNMVNEMKKRFLIISENEQNNSTFFTLLLQELVIICGRNKLRKRLN